MVTQLPKIQQPHMLTILTIVTQLTILHISCMRRETADDADTATERTISK